MAITDYQSLAAAMDAYTNRAGDATYAANRGVFVQRAHTVIMRELRIPLLQGTADLVIDGETVAQPADFRAVARLFIDADWDNPLNPTSMEGRVRIAVGNATARPLVYAIEGTSFAFAPIPDATYTGKLLYYKTLTLPQATTDTNAVLTRYPFLYFYGALAEYARFDRQDDDVALYEGLFGSELNAIQTAEQLDALGGGTLTQVTTANVV